MHTMTKQLETYKKEYVYQTGEYINGDYSHPYIVFIRLGFKYPEGYYMSREFEIRFQRNLYKDGWKLEKPSEAYGGTVEYLHLEQIESLAKIMEAVNKQVEKLNIYGGDSYKNMITCLRAAGYRQGNDYEHHIVSIE